jgi:hypothetical protein
MFANNYKGKPLKEKYGAAHRYEEFGCMPYYKANRTVSLTLQSISGPKTLLRDKFEDVITSVHCRKLNAEKKVYRQRAVSYVCFARIS